MENGAVSWPRGEVLCHTHQGVLYTYGFDCGAAKSPLGQFRLPPVPSQPLHSLDYAIFSCANRPGRPGPFRSLGLDVGAILL